MVRKRRYKKNIKKYYGGNNPSVVEEGDILKKLDVADFNLINVSNRTSLESDGLNKNKLDNQNSVNKLNMTGGSSPNGAIEIDVKDVATDTSKVNEARDAANNMQAARQVQSDGAQDANVDRRELEDGTIVDGSLDNPPPSLIGGRRKLRKRRSKKRRSKKRKSRKRKSRKRKYRKRKSRRKMSRKRKR